MSILNLSSINKIEKQVSSKMNPIVYPYGKNIFNKNTVTLDKYIMSTGELVSSDGWYVSDYIPVIANANIILREVTSSTNAHCAFYDISKNIILDSLLDNSSLIGNNRVRIVPNNAAYFRFSNRTDAVSNTDPSRMQVEYGVETTEYEEYSAHPKLPNLISTQDVNIKTDESISSFPTGVNLFNKDTITDNALMLTSGRVTPDSGWYVSDYIPVIENMDLFFRGVSGGTSASSAFFDKDKNIIEGTAIINSELIAMDNIRRVPIGAKFLRFSNQYDTNNHPSDPSKMQVEYGRKFTEYHKYNTLPRTPNFLEPQDVNVVKDHTVKNFPTGKNLFNKNTITNDVYLNKEGSIQNVPTYYLSDFIPVLEGANIILNGVVGTNNGSSAFYDINEEIIEESILPNNELVANGNKRVVPKGAHYFRFSGKEDSFANYDPSRMQVEYGENSTEYEAYDILPKTPNFISTQDVNIKTDESISSFPTGVNLFNKDTITDNTLLLISGKETPSSGWYVSDYIPVIENMDLFFRGVSGGTSASSAFFDKDKNIIADTAIINSELIAMGNTRRVPIGAKFLRFSNQYDTNNHPSDPSRMQVEYGQKFTEYHKYNTLPRIPNFIEPQEVVIKNEKNPTVDGYKLFSDRRDYQILKYNDGDELMAIHKNIAVRASSKDEGATISISTSGVNGEYMRKVIFNADNFPNLLPSSKIEHIVIIPYTRNLTVAQQGNNNRIVLITTLGQIYHNYPSKAVDSDGTASGIDIINFDQSVIWDLPNRKYPSTNPNASGVEKYTPGLPENNYRYMPAISQDNGFGNGGFPKQYTTSEGDTLSRFYDPNLGTNNHSFGYMGGFETSSKLTMLGTYRSNTGSGISASRTGVFATSDGGRSWFLKLEFASYSGQSTSGVEIDTSSSRYDDNSVGDFADYVDGSFVVKDITHNIPSEANKEPSTLFTVGSGIVVKSISKAKPAVITTHENHGLVNGAIIVVQDNPDSESVSPDWDWMRNDSLTASNGGNGRLFKIEKISETSFSLKEYVHNPFTNLGVRHIHCINRMPDGFTVGCGEVYPEGWMFYIPIHHADTYGVVRAEENLQIVRLNSSEDSAVRPLGFFILDDLDNTVIFGSDESRLKRPNLNLPEGRTDTVTRNSTGIFKAKLSDIDDFTKFECIFKAEEPAYIFKEKLGVWIFGGSRGEAGLSFDRGKSWQVNHFGSTLQRYKGTSDNIILIDDGVILLK